MKKIFLSLLLAASTMTMYAADGMLPGFFSVSADKTVAFSKGNLQATYDGSLWTWSFAEHQWDYIGVAVANTAISSNGVVSPNGTVDLFGWSTSKTYFGINPIDNTSTYSGDFKDWGQKIGEGWYTLSKEEWGYLFSTRTGSQASTVNEIADTRYAKATVNGVSGVILFPDGGIFAASEFTVVDKLNKVNAPFTATTCTADQWTALEAKGCVFLPTAGYRLGGAVYSGDPNGFYWLSTPRDEICAYSVYISPSYINPQNEGARSSGHSVRLVFTVKVGSKFKAASGDDVLQYEVTEISPDLKVKVTPGGHILKEGTDLVIPASVNFFGKTFAVKEVENGPQFGNAKTISLPNSLSKAVSWWTGDLSSLEAFIVADDNPLYTVVGGVLYTKDKVKLYRCPPKKAFTSADFLPETKCLGGRAFYKNTAIGDLVIPNTIEDTETTTFYGSSITSVFIPSSMTSLSNAEFGYCASLASVTFENSATMDLAWDSFEKSKILNDQEGDWKIIDSVAVKYTGTAETVALPDSIVNIVYSFINATGSAAANLKTVILPASLKNVYYQFLSFNSESQKYPNLEKIICKAQDVPHVVGTKLELNSAKDVTLVVPCGKGAEYSAATVFSDPFSMVEEDLVYDVTLKQTEGGTIAYTRMAECNGIELTATPAAGYEFVKWSDDNTDATRTVAVNSDVTFSAQFDLKATAIDQIANEQMSKCENEKIIINGQLYIIRDSKTYNAVGAEVK